MVLSGTNPERDLVEIVEIPDHPFFIGVQFHPEFKSRPLTPQPVFHGFVEAAKRLSNDQLPRAAAGGGAKPPAVAHS
ncbi:MAG: CTP synthase [Planctomycetota bacterium]|jgi:CTP synthase